MWLSRDRTFHWKRNVYDPWSLRRLSFAGGLAKNWVIGWIFNAVGALFVAYVLAFMGGITPTDASAPAYAISAKAISVAEGKLPCHLP